MDTMIEDALHMNYHDWLTANILSLNKELHWLRDKGKLAQRRWVSDLCTKLQKDSVEAQHELQENGVYLR